jgi:hypothetical protein
VAQDLELVETEDLIEALMRRFDHSVFVGMAVGVGSPQAIEIRRRWVGNSHTCMGLASDVGQAIWSDYQKRMEEGKAADESPDACPAFRCTDPRLLPFFRITIYDVHMHKARKGGPTCRCLRKI